jgi:hypothetical protein
VDVADLYHGPLDEFVARRTALARDTRSRDPSAAAAIGKMRKPPVPVWAIDQLAADRPELVVELLAAAADARDVQRAVAGQTDTREDLSRASARLRDTVETAARAAEHVLEQAGIAGSEGMGRRIRTTLQSAATGSGAERLALWRGSLDHEVAPSGFGTAGSPEIDCAELAAVIAPLRHVGPKDRSRPATARTRPDSDAVARAAAERAATKQDEAAGRARHLATAKRRHADSLAEELRRAEDEAAAAEQAADAAEKTATAAHAALEP